MKSTPRYRDYALKMLNFYPRTWRERYADEAAAVLEARPANFLTLFDLLLGLLDAYVHRDLFTERNFEMAQQLRNYQLTIFGSFVFCTPFLVLYLLFGPRNLPGWDVTGMSGNALFFVPQGNLIVVLTLSALGCALLACLWGAGTLFWRMFKQAGTGFSALLWNLLSFGTFVLLIGAFASLVLFQRYVLMVLMLNIVEILPFAFVLCQIISNVLRLRQGMQEKSLSLRFMLPTLLPGLLGVVALGTIYSMATQQLSFILLRLASLLHQSPGQMSIYLLVLSCLVVLSALAALLFYARGQIKKTAFEPGILRLTFVPAALTVLAMVAILLVQLYHVWSIDTHINAQGWTLLRVPLLHVAVLGTAISTIIAGRACWKAFKARRWQAAAC